MYDCIDATDITSVKVPQSHRAMLTALGLKIGGEPDLYFLKNTKIHIKLNR